MQNVKLGDRFTVKPEFCGGPISARKMQRGAVVWIHPAGRFAVLEFEGIQGKPRECFYLKELKK